MRRWLADPTEEIAALSFLPEAHISDLGRDGRTPRRVSARSTSGKRSVLSVDVPSETAAKRPEPRIGVTFRD
jgi:hypothetical protein